MMNNNSNKDILKIEIILLYGGGAGKLSARLIS